MEKLSVNNMRELIKNVKELGYSKEKIMDITGLKYEEIVTGRVHGPKPRILEIKTSLLSFSEPYKPEDNSNQSE